MIELNLLIPPEVPEKGDISDYMKNHTKEDLQKLIDDALNEDPVKQAVRECAKEVNVTATKNTSLQSNSKGLDAL